MVAPILLPLRSRQISPQQRLCGCVKYYSHGLQVMSNKIYLLQKKLEKCERFVTCPALASSSTTQVHVDHEPPGLLSTHLCTGASYEQLYEQPPGFDTTCDLQARYTMAHPAYCIYSGHPDMPAGSPPNTSAQTNHSRRSSRPCLYPALAPASGAPAHLY